jgi:hypothetical protein
MAESTHMRAVDSAEPPAGEQPVPGLTGPARRGGSGRFLTDVLIDRGYIDRGYTDRETVERAIEKAHEARGHTGTPAARPARHHP